MNNTNILVQPPAVARAAKQVKLNADLVIVGAGMAGVCCAIEAARAGLKVVLIQDRPVPGGNASSEVRLWLLGATNHMTSNHRYSREGGVINEIFLENLWRNPDGNPVLFDTVLLEKLVAEKNLMLLLNTACFAVDQAAGGGRIAGVRAFNSQNSTMYEATAPLFCDASGDGIVGFLAGAAFRMGAETREEFGEKFAPDGDFGFLLGSSLYFYTKDAGHPVEFVPPAFALRDLEQKIPRYTHFNAGTDGCKLWWIEWGGRLDTVHDAEDIKWELWRVVYGVWHYIKNSGKFPEARNLTLEWVGTVPGKRESRRFEGDYILRQSDVVERKPHRDAVAYGGWSIDLHPADGVYAKIAGSHHLHQKGVYQIPYRCYYSRNVENLFLAGRLISATHVAHGTTRVMATCALGGQAVGAAAALCAREGKLPRAIGADDALLRELQTRLARSGHHLPGVTISDPANLANAATVSVSSEFVLKKLPADGPTLPLDKTYAQLLPLPASAVPAFEFTAAEVARDTTLTVELRTTSGPWHFTPDVVLEKQTLAVRAGHGVPLPVNFAASMPADGYAFVILGANPDVTLATSEQRVTGLARLRYSHSEDYAKIGGESYDTFIPDRRPGGHNLAFTVSGGLACHGAGHLQNCWQRPTCRSNAWVAAAGDAAPTLTLTWLAPQKISRVSLFFDGDYDFACETVLWWQPERVPVFCVKRYEIRDARGEVIVSVDDNHQAAVHHDLSVPLVTDSLTVNILETWGAPAAVFAVNCY
ncbi:MAG: FAD-dependent oxidoreductase [Verrucomicrobiales bacterium]|jgi:hypothetical protein|nr:FAD-dependent oxidoreductase [Verrucomicrobiales bacterium]